MSVLVDHQINQALGANPPLADNVPLNEFGAADSRVQAASLELTIGDIFIPGTEPTAPGGADSPRDRWCLLEGHTAVVRTYETLAVPNTLMAIGFPPTRLSTKGILMTNPGEVDPGYVGPLHLTIINMGREPFELRRGDRVMRLVFLRLADTPTADYAARHPNPATPVINNQLLQTLSDDFVNVKERATNIADDAVKRATIRSTVIAAAVTGVLGLAGAIYMHYADGSARLEARMTVLEAGLNKLGTTVDVTKLVDRTERLEDDVKHVQAATEALAHPAPLPSPGETPAINQPTTLPPLQSAPSTPNPTKNKQQKKFHAGTHG